MTREHLKTLLPVLEAWAEGRKIAFKPNEWPPDEDIEEDWVKLNCDDLSLDLFDSEKIEWKIV